MYRMVKTVSYGVEYISVMHNNGNEQYISFPADPANTDYQTFKAQINADEAQLQDADGNTMSAEDARQFVSTLP